MNNLKKNVKSMFYRTSMKFIVTSIVLLSIIILVSCTEVNSNHKKKQ